MCVCRPGQSPTPRCERELRLPESSFCLSLRQNDDVLRLEDAVRRSWSLGYAGRCDGEHIQLASGSTEGVQMVRVVPEHLIDWVRGQQASVLRDRVRAVEVEYLQSRTPPYRKEFTGG